MLAVLASFAAASLAVGSEDRHAYLYDLRAGSGTYLEKLGGSVLPLISTDRAGVLGMTAAAVGSLILSSALSP